MTPPDETLPYSEEGFKKPSDRPKSGFPLPTEGRPSGDYVNPWMVADNTSPNEAGERVVEFGDGMYNLDKGEGYRNLSRKETEYLANVFPVKPEGTVQVKAEGDELYLQRNGRRIEITEDQDFTFGYFFPELEAVAGGTTRDPQEEKGLGTLGKVAALGICAGAALAGGAYSLMDSDGDRSNNISEWLGPTDYRNPDTDGDTLKDGMDDHPTKNDFPVTSYAEDKNLPRSVVKKLSPLDEDLDLNANERALVDELGKYPKEVLVRSKVMEALSSAAEDGQISEEELNYFANITPAPVTSYAEGKDLPAPVVDKLKVLDEDLQIDSKERFLVDVISNHSSEIAGNQTFLDELSGATEDEEITRDEINYLADVGTDSSEVPSNIPHGVRKQKPEVIDEGENSVDVSNFELLLDYKEGNLKDSLINFSVKSEEGKITDAELILNNSHELSPEDSSYDEPREEFSRVLGGLEEGNLYKGKLEIEEESSYDFINFKVYPREFVNIADDDNMKVVAHYFPWKYEKNDEDLVYQLLMGDYDPTNQEDINKHIDWATGHGIDAFALTWNGLNNHTTDYINNNILEAYLIDDIEFMIDYCWGGEVGNVDFAKEKYERRIKNEFKYFNENYFENPQYLEVGNRKAVFLYGSKIFEGDVEKTMNDLRDISQEKGNKLYLIGDEMGFRLLKDELWTHFKLDRMKNFDGLSAFSLLYHDYEGDLKDYAKKSVEVFSKFRDESPVDVIPFVQPGYNDRKIRPNRENPILERDVSTFKEFFNQAKKTAEKGPNVIMINSFNEWNESSQVEPAEEYGFDYLETIKNKLAGES